MRDERLDFTGTAVEENMLYYSAGVNGLFTEYPHITRAIFQDSEATLNMMQQKGIPVR